MKDVWWQCDLHHVQNKMSKFGCSQVCSDIKTETLNRTLWKRMNWRNFWEAEMTYSYLREQFYLIFLKWLRLCHYENTFCSEALSKQSKGNLVSLSLLRKAALLKVNIYDRILSNNHDHSLYQNDCDYHAIVL